MDIWEVRYIDINEWNTELLNTDTEYYKSELTSHHLHKSWTGFRAQFSRKNITSFEIYKTLTRPKMRLRSFITVQRSIYSKTPGRTDSAGAYRERPLKIKFPLIKYACICIPFVFGGALARSALIGGVSV